jgi:hypothetical protein
MESPDNPELVPESGAVNFDYENFWPDYCNPAYTMPDIIEVKVSVGLDHYFFPVTVVKAVGRKLYLGGYRHKLTAKVYHHASTQTPTDHRKQSKDYGNLRSRETQTVETKTRSIQGYRESGTQMERIDLRTNNNHDMILYAKPYITAEEVLVQRKASAITMQRYWRGFVARRRANEVRQRNADYQRELTELARQQYQIEEEQRIRDALRRTHPKNNADFAVLYNELEEWRKQEVNKIKLLQLDPEARRLALNELLTNETKALQSLQLLKAAAAKEVHHEKTEEMLQQMAQPLKWQLSHGEVAMVHTPETQRAKELLDLFHAMHVPLQSNDQRLETLLKVKVRYFTTVLSYFCLTKNFIIDFLL